MRLLILQHFPHRTDTQKKRSEVKFRTRELGMKEMCLHKGSSFIPLSFKLQMTLLHLSEPSYMLGTP